MKNTLIALLGVLILVPGILSGQSVIGGTAPDPSAVLDVQGTDGGLLLPRLSSTERNAISSPATGLIIMNTTTLCVEMNTGTSATPLWKEITCRAGEIGALNCAGATTSAQIEAGQAISGVNVSVPYTGGNGGQYNGQVLTSTGITGLAATLAAGYLADGAGNLTCALTGTASGLGTASFSLNIGGQSCTLGIPVVVIGTVSTLDCSLCARTSTGTLVNGQAATGVSVSMPYTGGNGGVHAGQTVTSTGVTGLTATLSAGSFATGAGTVVYNITGTPASAGTASFALNIGGQMCTLDVNVLPSGTIVCSAKVSASETKNFMCYNLGAANTSADPFTPSWEINGGYWQWGRAAEAAAGPTGPGAGQANSGAISGWNTTNAADGSWADGSKTANDPCPTGFRVPTKAQWEGVVANNIKTNVGTFSSDPTNYCAGKKFGDNLMLPAAGYRSTPNGALYDRGYYGNYWSSTEDSNNFAWYLGIGVSSSVSMFNWYRVSGYSIRCIAELQGTLGTLNCAGASVTGTLTSGQAASGVSASVPYTGGNSGVHTGQTVTSTGVTGLTATVAAGSFASGAGNLTYNITGTPASGGMASFALNIGGQTCSLDVTVTVIGTATLNCAAATTSGVIRTSQNNTGITMSVPYTAGNGGPYSGQTISSTGVTGLTATLSAGNFATGSGSLSFAITGTPSGAGAATFALTIGGQSCNLVTYAGCGAFVAAGNWKEFSCYNLGAANTSADPFTPGWEINGGYWQWGRAAQAAAGPTGPNTGQANGGAITGWNTTDAANGSWADGSKTGNDPCPSGFRVPTKSQWNGVLANNIKTNVGTDWTGSATNYSTGKKFGNNLMLPAAGLRSYENGTLNYRGNYGFYWSSTEYGTNSAWNLLFYSSGADDADSNFRSNGFSVRCIAE
jgi:uncharacterized protein (TIGR02145 family)